MKGVPLSHRNLRLPDSLTELDQWVLWRYEERGGKATKVPFQVNGRTASSTDHRTWAPFEAVSRLWKANPKRYAGIGFVFTKTDPFVGIDLDDALDEKERVKPWAQRIIERFADSYMEVSPSGRGVKIWAGGSLPANLGGVPVGDGFIELYDHSRYFCVTGRRFRGAPLEIENHVDDVLALYERLCGPRKKWAASPDPAGRIPKGKQHNTLVSLCGTLRARGVCEEAIEACLQIVNEKQCERPGTREEIREIVRSTRRWAG